MSRGNSRVVGGDGFRRGKRMIADIFGAGVRWQARTMAVSRHVHRSRSRDGGVAIWAAECSRRARRFGDEGLCHPASFFAAVLEMGEAAADLETLVRRKQQIGIRLRTDNAIKVCDALASASAPDLDPVVADVVWLMAIINGLFAVDADSSRRVRGENRGEAVDLGRRSFYGSHSGAAPIKLSNGRGRSPWRRESRNGEVACLCSIESDTGPNVLG